MAGYIDGLGPEGTPSSTSTVPNKYSHLLTQAERAAGGFGCNIHLLLRTSAPPKVREADVACTPKEKTCSSRVIEAEIAKNRSALAKALADVLLEGLWQSAQSGSNSSGSNCSDGTGSSNSQSESPPDSQPSSTGTPPTNLSHLLAVAERAAEYFGCDLNGLLRSATPPKVDDADVICSLNERCTSRALEEAIAKARAALADALADVLLEALWQSTRSTSNCHDGTDDSSCNWHSESTGQGTGQSGQQQAEAKEPYGKQEFPHSGSQPPLSPAANDEPRLTHWLGQVGKAPNQTPQSSAQAHRDPNPRSPPTDLTGGNTSAMERTQSPAPRARGSHHRSSTAGASSAAAAAGRRATFTSSSLRSSGCGLGGLAAKVPPTVTVATFLKTARDARAISATTGGAFELASDVPIRFTATQHSSSGGTASQDDAERWVLNGRYEFISRLDPSGALWQVAHLATGEPLSVKIVPRGRLMHRRFNGHPRSVLDLFQHPNTVPLYEVIDDPCCNSIFLVTPLPQPLPFSLELTSGHLAGKKGPTLEIILNYAKGAASALAVFHAAGIVHCDIKLENLLLLSQKKATEEAQSERLVLAEFVACQLDVNLAKAGGHMCVLNGRNDGTLAYWAPECFAAKKQSNPFTAASDCYALGLCLYVMAFGQFPYWTTDAAEPLSWAKVIPGTQCYEGVNARVEVPQVAHAQGIILGEILQGLLTPSEAERMPAAKVVELTQ